MKPSSELKKFIILIALLVGPGVLLIYLSKADHKFVVLPYFGEREVVYADGSDVPDTVYHTVPDFLFVNQDGEDISFADLEGKIIVADFFFTTCPTICPIMTKQMTRLQWMLNDAAYKDIHFLSHTVNPNYDTPEVLKAYAEDNGADLSKWTFLTGNQEDIFEQGFYGYLISALEDDAAPGGFLHSSLFILVDKNRHIRGFYDGTSTKEVDDLVVDIKMLLKEEVMKPSEIVRQ